MKKIVINKCFGGFSISPLAVKEVAARKGRPCYFFIKPDFKGPYVPCEMPKETDWFWSAFDIENPNEVLNQDGFYQWTMEERQASNALYRKHEHDNRPKDRSDPDLVAVVEMLGEKANGQHAELAVVEIPDDVEYEISEYDGREHIAEQHRTWG